MNSTAVSAAPDRTGAVVAAVGSDAKVCRG